MSTYNTSPYYDDFDEDKNFHRILFKPGVAVQARELTQLQTILQDQISKFGKHVFKDGSVVLGGEIFIDRNTQSVRLQTTYNGSAIDVTSMANLFAKGSVTGLIGQVKYAYVADDPVTGDPPTIVIKPRNAVNLYQFDSEEEINFYPSQVDAINESNVAAIGAVTIADTSLTKTCSCSVYSTKVIASSTTGINVGDVVTASGITKTLYVVSIDSSTELTVNDTAGVELTSTTFTFTQKNTQPTLEISVSEGVYFKSGYFVKTLPQSIIPKKYTAYPSASVGLTVSESTITSDDDEALLDPAIESYNYFAPGADRIKVGLTINSLAVTDGVADQTSDPNFIELVRVTNGVINKEISKTQYSAIDDALARRTYDESGNYTVKPFILNITDTSDSETTLNVDVLPGSAYVNGYRYETIAPIRINLDKARDTESVTGYQISPYYGNYILANIVGYSLPTLGSNVELHVGNTTHTSATKVGTAYLKQIDYDSGSTTGSVYKVFLQDINLTSNTFGNVKHIVKTQNNAYDSGNVKFLANVDATGRVANVTQLYDAAYDSLIFPLPQGSISTVTTTDYEFRKVYTDVTFTSGVSTITTSSSSEDFVGGTGTLSTSIAKQYYYAVSKTASGTFTKGQMIPMDGSGRTVNIAVVPAGSPGSAQIDLNDASFNGLCDVYATIQVTGDTRKTKTLVANAVLAVNMSANVANSLSVSDVYSVTGVYQIGSNIYAGAWSSLTTYNTGNAVVYNGLTYTANATSTNINPVNNTTYWTSVTPITSSLIKIDNGQRDNYYDHGTVTYLGGSSTGNAIITYSYFTHSGGLGYFTGDSYPVSRSKIPTYTSTKTGTFYSLADSYDFRPRRTDGSSYLTFDNYQIPTPYSFIDSNYSYYLQRIDKIAIQNGGAFKTIKGVSSFTNPNVPLDDPEAMTIATIQIPAYTTYAANVKVDYTSKRRYTMRDIGDIDQRLKNVEYYTALSFLEKEVLAATVVDANNSALFKNGYLVDSFSGFTVIDVTSPEYGFGTSVKVSVDKNNGFARPPFDSSAYGYTFDSAANPDVVKTESLITFPYTEKTFLKQSVASKVINVNPFNIVSFLGVLKITPNSDFWYDSVSRPIINIINNDDAAFAVANAQAGTQWNDWQTTWVGKVYTQWYAYKTKNVVKSLYSGTTYSYDHLRQYKQNRTGIQTDVGSKVVLQTDTSAVVAQDAIPIARQAQTSFKIYGMPPLTELTCYINTSINVAAYVTPKGKTQGAKLVTDNSGFCEGTLILPNTNSIQIPTGKIRISFANSDISYADALSRAEAIFTSTGILNTIQRTTVSTREPVLIRTAVSQDQTLTEVVDSGNYTVPSQDPLAQSFYVDGQTYPNGIFLTSAELYFATKDDSIPVKMHIRPIENGYPSSTTIIPFSETYVDSANVIVPADSATIYDQIGAPTKFTFDAPVYLAPSGYSLVVSSASDNYNIYAAEMGQTILGSTNKIMSQPYTGVLFKSQNADTWNAYQTEDMCFKLNQAVFDTGTVSCVLDIKAPEVTKDFDITNHNTQELNFTGTSTAYEISTTTKSGGTMTDYSAVTINSNNEMSERMSLSAAGDISTRITLKNSDPNVSPVVDTERLNTIVIKNKVDAYDDTINTSELTAYGGSAQAKYITRRVTLAEGFDATGINVLFNLERRVGTSVKVYYKILNKYDSTNFDERPWVQMSEVTNSGEVAVYTNPGELIETNFKALDIQYTNGGATYTDFNTLAIKIAFFTDNTAIVPQISSLRVTAVS